MEISTWIALGTLLISGGGFAIAGKLARRLFKLTDKLVDTTGALKELADAQLTENGGGSLVDKVNKTASALPKLQQTVEQNHAEARERWLSLDRLDGEVRELKTALGAVRLDVAEFKRGQEFFRRFAPLLLNLETEERRNQIRELAERVLADMGPAQ